MIQLQCHCYTSKFIRDNFSSSCCGSCCASLRGIPHKKVKMAIMQVYSTDFASVNPYNIYPCCSTGQPQQGSASHFRKDPLKTSPPPDNKSMVNGSGKAGNPLIQNMKKYKKKAVALKAIWSRKQKTSQLKGISPADDAACLKSKGRHMLERRIKKYATYVNIFSFNVRTLSTDEELDRLLETLKNRM